MKTRNSIACALAAGLAVATAQGPSVSDDANLPPPKELREPATTVQPMEAGTRETKPELNSPLKVTITPGQTGPRDIYDELTFFVEMENIGNEVITLNYVYLLVGDDVKRTRPDALALPGLPVPETPVPPEAGRVRGALNQPADGTWEGREVRLSIPLQPRGKLTERLIIPRCGLVVGSPPHYRNYIFTLMGNPYLLGFSPREHDVSVMVEYAVGANADLSMRSTVSVPFTATWGAIMLGGIVGVLMLCFLRVLVAFKPVLLALVAPPRRKAAPHVEPPVEKDAPAAPHAAARTVAVAPTGVSRIRRVALVEMISAMVWLPSVIIISFLVWRMGPSSFPITFQVNDFAGGVLLGLFTRALIEPLIRKLLPPEPEPARGPGHRGERDSASEGEAGSDRIPDKAEPETAGA
jgi:hypothetical protein